MKLIGNILWFLFGGFECGLSWIFSGFLCCITIIGIPIGLQCFKIGSLMFFPFGIKVKNRGGGLSFLANIFCVIFCGLPLAIVHSFFGLLWCMSIIGIPFGLQFFKIASLSLAPFGKILT